MSYADKTLTCRECGRNFVFTAGEQEFHAQKGFSNAPVRCPQCRAQRKANDSFSEPRRNAGPREMHTVICSACGKEAQVPFAPRGDKPVFCNDCFQAQRDHSPRW